jgi:hypothetical protein
MDGGEKRFESLRNLPERDERVPEKPPWNGHP